MGFVPQLVKYLLILVALVALFRAAYLFPPEQLPQKCKNTEGHQPISLAADPRILDRFIGALNIATISYKPHDYEAGKMLEMINYIEQSELMNEPCLFSH